MVVCRGEVFYKQLRALTVSMDVTTCWSSLGPQLTPLTSKGVLLLLSVGRKGGGVLYIPD